MPHVRVTGPSLRGAALALVVPGSAERYLLGAPRGAADTLAELRRHRGGAPVTLAGVVPAEDDEEESGDGAPLSLIVELCRGGCALSLCGGSADLPRPNGRVPSPATSP